LRVRPEEEQREGQGELAKFMVFVAIMLLAVLLVSASRPFIFEWLVPAALGWGTPTPGDLPAVPSLAAPTMLPASLEPTSAAGTEPATRADVLVPAATVTPQPTATPQSYQVQPGDNLTTIARRFGVPVEALIGANGLTNPNQLRPDDLLIIPTP
jgi:LysM repeat protein